MTNPSLDDIELSKVFSLIDGGVVARHSIDVNAVQLPKALSPMFVKLLPIVTLVSPVQFLKAREPMLVTLLGIVMLVRAVQL